MRLSLVLGRIWYEPRTNQRNDTYRTQNRNSRYRNTQHMIDFLANRTLNSFHLRNAIDCSLFRLLRCSLFRLLPISPAMINLKMLPISPATINIKRKNQDGEGQKKRQIAVTIGGPIFFENGGSARSSYGAHPLQRSQAQQSN